MVLQLNIGKAKEEPNWIGFLCLQQSELVPGRTAVVAVRDIQMGTPVGVYTGPVIWKPGEA